MKNRSPSEGMSQRVHERDGECDPPGAMSASGAGAIEGRSGSVEVANAYAPCRMIVARATPILQIDLAQRSL